VKRRTRKILGAAMAIALTVTVIAAVVWVTATTQGTRWLLTSVTTLSGISFNAQKIEGRLIDHLLLTEVRLSLAQQRVEIASLELRWKPLLLLAGTIAVQELVINGVRIQDDAPPDNKPPILAWPRVSEFEQMFDGKIARLRVTDLVYRRLQEQPVRVTSIAGSVTWQDSLLSLSDLKAVSPSGQIDGSVSAGFKQPSLTADLTIALTQPVAEMDRFSLQARESHGTGPEQFVGTIAVAGSAGTRKLLELDGEVGMARNAINLRRLRLTRPGQKGLLTGDGSLAFTALESVLTLQIKAAGLDLAPELNVPTNLSGTLRFAGTLDSYRGDFTLANQAQGWQAAAVSATYQGTREGMKLAPLTARVIDGSLAGNLDMNWRDGFAMQGAISGRNLNPARIAPDWKGVANFNVAGKLAWSGKTPVTGNVSGALLESTLHGQALTGGLQANFANNNLSLARLALHGKGFDMHASGELNQRISLTAQISDFSRLVPESAGTLQTEGWVRWRDGQLSGAVVGTGSKLAYAGTRIAAANLNARLDQGEGYPLHVAASLQDVIYDGYTLNAVTLAADGTLQRHTLNATLRSAGAEARLSLSAGYKAGVWAGEITRLAGRDNSGPWNLTAPAAFAVSSGNLSLSPLALTAGAAERLEVAVELALNPLSGQVRAQWAGLNLARANPYLKDVQVTGSSRGTVRVGFLSGNRLTLTGSAAGSGTFTGQGRSITIQRSQITFDGSEQGLRVGIELGTADGGRLKGTFSSPAPFRLVMPAQGELTAELSEIDLALLKPWIPSDTRLEGRISGRAKGSMLPGQRFELDGNAVLSRGTLRQSRPDGELNLTFKAASASWGWRDETLAGTLSLTMAEHGQVRTNFQLPVPARFPVAVNPKGPLRASITGQLQDKGIITALFPGLIQQSSGELDADLDISGTWAVPQVEGKLRLAKAGAYLPTAGIQLKNVQLAVRLEKDLMRGTIELGTADGGRLKGTFSSPAPLRLVMPERGELTADLSGIDLALLKPWLPRDTRLEGRISGRVKGIMLPGQRFELDGNAVLSGGTLHQAKPDGELNLTFTAATASWGWRGETLAGTLSLTMAEHGQARANFQLPVPARFPVAVNPKGPLRASLIGQVQEKGIITTLFPGLVQESSGELDADLDISGTWAVPQIEGKLRLAKAGAYLPTAGIHLKDVQLAARLEKNLILIDSFKAVSGPGHIEGTALITLARWRVTGYQGTIRGEKFQTVFFPELRILSTPNLSFEGTPQKIKLRGELRLPDMHIVGAQTRPVVTPSSDVVREGRVVPAAKSSPLVMDVQVRVLLGEQVFVKVSGIDAQLGGAIDLSLSSLDRITSKGEIKVVKGRYRTYGVNLEIVRGRLFFAGGPINRPALDFLALRTIGNVRAGVTVAGNLQRPVTKLYSEPAMPDVDVLAYIVLGRPLGSSGDQASLLTQAAGALLTSSKATVLQEQLKSRLGLSTLEIQGGVGGTNSYMGYKPLQVTPPGAIPAEQQSGITETVLTVGKYLTPQLYISYGKSLFTGSNLFRLRYDIFKHWQIETQTGSGESGADLYYKMEFK
jgi:translocation and assembly module TamB